MATDKAKSNAPDKRDRRRWTEPPGSGGLMAAGPALAAALVLLLATLCAGCGSARQTGGDRSPEGPSGTVRPGMTPEDVRVRLGAPLDTVQVGGRLRWMIYGTEIEEVFLFVQNGRVKAIPPILDQGERVRRDVQAKRRVEESPTAQRDGKNRSE